MHLHIQAALQDHEHVYLDETLLRKFISYLITQAEVYAPHKKGDKSFSFKPVQDVNQVILNYSRTIQPLKKYFLPPRETLLDFNMNENAFTTQSIEVKKRIFLGVHSYDLQAVHRLDYNFKTGNPESNYLTRREQSIFIGVSYKPDDFHFGKSVGIEIEKTDGMSLYLEQQDNGYIAFVMDEIGRELLTGFGEVALQKDNVAITAKEFNQKIKYHYNRLPQVFDQAYQSKVWQKVSEKCLGCGTCNLLCPTCYCFDVRDEIELDAESGKRERFWDGCMLNSFAEVAGGENFRDKLHNRTRHRLYRKFKYITDHSGELSCVGCGRCSGFCPANISIVGIINDLIEEVSHKNVS